MVAQGERARSASDTSVVLELVAGLCRELRAAGIPYCHWKSNDALARSLAGENDLDLLVRGEDARRVDRVLRRLSFVEAVPPRPRAVPGVVDYYGLDASTGRTVHAHVHHRLAVGDDMTKNYRLPMEDAYLASVIDTGLLPVPAVEFELVAFVLRMVLKHGAADAQLTLRGRLGASESRELRYLLERADRARAAAIVDAHLPHVGAPLFGECVASLTDGASPMRRARVAARLERCLASDARYTRSADVVLKLGRRTAARLRRYVLRRPSKKRLAGRGRLIAIVGGDGAGKSTLLDGMARSLRRQFVVRTVHLGKPRRPIGSYLVKGSMAAGRKLGLFRATRLPAQATIPLRAAMREHADRATGHRSDRMFPGYAWLLWHLVNARDRYRVYKHAVDAARRGEIVLCDRYPLDALTLMDGSRTTGLDVDALPLLARRLVRLERRYYERILPPDLLIVLRVDPSVAVARRRDQDEEFVRARNREVYEADWQRNGAVVLDASRGPDEILERALAAAWSEFRCE